MTNTCLGRLLPLFLLLLAGCCATPDPTFVAASRATIDAVAPEYLGYVQADPALDAEQKARRVATIARWREAIEAREAKR